MTIIHRDAVLANITYRAHTIAVPSTFHTCLTATPTANKFQENLLKTVIQLESVYLEMSEMDEEHNVLIVCDRGAMDPSACV